jgi:hypothetical protein
VRGFAYRQYCGDGFDETIHVALLQGLAEDFIQNGVISLTQQMLRPSANIRSHHPSGRKILQFPEPQADVMTGFEIGAIPIAVKPPRNDKNDTNPWCCCWLYSS